MPYQDTTLPLSYMGFKTGGSGEIRTLDQRIKSPLLYRLSYASMENYNILYPKVGFEPTTSHINTTDSTLSYFEFWWFSPESNWEPSAYETDALTD
jgi:hypothetical protein